MPESLVLDKKPYYIYEFERGDVVLRGTAKEIMEQIGGNYRSFISMSHVQEYKNKPVTYKGFRVKRIYKVIPTTVYKLSQEKSDVVSYGTAKELARKFGFNVSTLYIHVSSKRPIHRRGKTFYITQHGVKDVWKSLK